MNWILHVCLLAAMSSICAASDPSPVSIVTEGEVLTSTKEEVRKRMAMDELEEREAAALGPMMYARGKPAKENWGGGSFTIKQQKAIIASHNEHRKGVRPRSSDMTEIVWSSKLAEQAQEWSDGCYYEHPSKSQYPDYAGIGQNLYIKWMDKGGKNPPPVEDPVDKWYGEEKDYDYEHNSCNYGAVCGHFTQVVWAHTAKVGCGIKFCPKARSQSKTFNDAWIVTCNYSPAGNMVGESPYKEGQRCAACEKGFCRDGLCSKCKAGDKGCECNLDCQNCGTLDRAKCKCACQDGFYGPNCANRCEDTDSNCGGNPGWPASWCNNDQYPFVTEKCPALCKLCKPGKGRPRC